MARRTGLTLWCFRCGVEGPHRLASDGNSRVYRCVACEDRDRLHSAAPKLLAALREMVELWDDNHPDDPCACSGSSEDCPVPPRCELCDARAAIAQAEGTP
jgi:hypothetical protein